MTKHNTINEDGGHQLNINVTFEINLIKSLLKYDVQCYMFTSILLTCDTKTQTQLLRFGLD